MNQELVNFQIRQMIVQTEYMLETLDRQIESLQLLVKDVEELRNDIISFKVEE